MRRRLGPTTAEALQPGGLNIHPLELQIQKCSERMQGVLLGSGSAVGEKAMSSDLGK